MKKILSAIIAAAAVLAAASCSQKPQTGPAVLTGEIIGDCSQLVILTYKTGEMPGYLYPVLNDGKFELVLDDVEGFIDMAVAVDDDVFGARVNANDTLGILVTPAGNGRFDVAYIGDTEKESRIWTDFYDTYDYLGQYNLKPDKDPSISEDESIRMVDEKDAAFRARYGASLDKYYVKNADMRRDFLHAVLLESKAFAQGDDYMEWPEYVALFKDIDPNDPMVLSCGLLNRWALLKMNGTEGSTIKRCTSFMDGYARKIKSINARNMLAELCVTEVMSHPEEIDGSNFDSFLGHLASFSPDGPELVDFCTEVFRNYNATKPGAAMPDVTMRGADGNDIQLSSLFGKVIYMDMWATWCGPCVQEIPYLEKLVERFKDNEDIVFISVSLDDTDEPWLKKLAEDKPSWPQYWLAPQPSRDFCGKLNISTIPRFIIVGREGFIADPDAPRPSSDGIDEILLALCRDDE